MNQNWQDAARSKFVMLRADANKHAMTARALNDEIAIQVRNSASLTNRVRELKMMQCPDGATTAKVRATIGAIESQVKSIADVCDKLKSTRDSEDRERNMAFRLETEAKSILNDLSISYADQGASHV